MGYFVPLHLVIKLNTKVLTGGGETFGTSDASSAIHSITPSFIYGAAMATIRKRPAMTIIKQLYGNFESLASAATSRNFVLDRLTASTTTQYTNITRLLSKIDANSSNANSAAAATINPCNTITRPPALTREEKDKINHHITQLKAEV